MIVSRSAKILFFISLFVVAISVSCHAETSKVYKFDDLGFSIESPSGHEAQKYENTVSILLLKEGENKKFKPNVTLSSTRNSKPPIDLDRFFGLVLQNFLKDTNFTMLLAERTKFENRDAYRLLYKRAAVTKDIGNNPISTKVLQIYIVEMSRLYVMNYSAAEEDYDAYLPMADGIMRSFRVIEETTSTMVGKKSATPELPDIKF